MPTDTWTQRWNERYRREEYAYGELPNAFLKAKMEQLTPGKALFPAEGEGRNAVFAAKLGWNVAAFDISEEGRKKALKLAEKNGVSLEYTVGDLSALSYEPESFDLIALIFAHFPADIKSQYHRALSRYLRAGGYVIFEAFSKKHPEYQAKNENVGGPRDLASLFSIEEIRADFADFDLLELSEQAVYLEEGPFHSGEGSVIRLLGRKKNI